MMHLLQNMKKILLKDFIYEFTNKFEEFNSIDHEWRLFINPFNIQSLDNQYDLQL